MFGGNHNQGVRPIGGRYCSSCDGKRSRASPSLALFGQTFPACNNRGTDATAQDCDVLHCGNQPVLDFLPPESAPARAIEVMLVGCLRKTAFHQAASSGAISIGLGQAGAGRVRSQAFLLSSGAHQNSQVCFRCSVRAVGKPCRFFVGDAVGHLPIRVRASARPTAPRDAPPGRCRSGKTDHGRLRTKRPDLRSPAYPIRITRREPPRFRPQTYHPPNARARTERPPAPPLPGENDPLQSLRTDRTEPVARTSGTDPHRSALAHRHHLRAHQRRLALSMRL